METTMNFLRQTPVKTTSDDLFRLAIRVKELNRLNREVNDKSRIGEFKKITPADMPLIWSYLSKESGRTTDFSYAGVLMWVDYFNYEYTIYKDTLFIKGVVENDVSTPAFSLPIGELPLKESVELLKEYCDNKNIRLEFSAIPEYVMGEMRKLNPIMIEELTDWGDYLYNAEPLATLKGKKMSKKRNHVNKFNSLYTDWKAVELTSENAHEAMEFMDIFDLEGDSTDMAKAERQLSRNLISLKERGDENLKGMILYVDGKVCAYTIGDIKGDTLFVHVEKATRNINGSYEMINYLFAKEMTEKNPEILYINREDDAGDIGLRMAKESYHPKEILKKYNVVF
ncbi:MAG: DUF2156 domain-containing protein [Bacteroides sp.]|nr:DUF2156 domain-containing protein [Bacteroides sp.]